MAARTAGQHIEPPSTVLRLRRVEAWRRARLERLLSTSNPDRTKRIRAARLYLEVGARRMAAERGIIDR